VAAHDLALCLGCHSADVGSVGLVVGALAQLAHALHEACDELVVDGRFDVDALDRHAELPGVGEAAPRSAVDRALQVGVGEHDHRVLSAELQAARNQPLAGALGDLAAGGGRAGELDVVDLVDERCAGRAEARDAAEHVRCAEILTPGTHDLAPCQRRHLRGLRQDCAADHQRGDDVPDRDEQRKIPGRDDANELLWAVDDAKALGGIQRAVRA